MKTDETGQAIATARARALEHIASYLQEVESTEEARQYVAIRRERRAELEARAQMLAGVKSEKTESQREAAARVALLDSPVADVLAATGGTNGDGSGTYRDDPRYVATADWDYATVCLSLTEWESAVRVREARAECARLRVQVERGVLAALGGTAGVLA